MKQSGTSITNANLQEFLDSATNAAELGQRQFFTPEDVAAVLSEPLSPLHKEFLADLHIGSGNIPRSIGASSVLGLDIDARSARELKQEKWHVTQADITKWYPLAAEADLTLPYIGINPPFSLKWESKKLKALRDSHLNAVADTAARHPETIDSTLASLLIAIDRLAMFGEGFMICNASTARRLIGDPQGDGSPIMSHIHLWLEIPNVAYENVNENFDTAVLYFTQHDDNGTTYCRADSASPPDIRKALNETNASTLNRGMRYRYAYEIGITNIIETWDAINEEYAVRHKNRQPSYNISLTEKGTIRTYLTPFQETSQKIDRKLIQQLHAIRGQTPMALCVTSTSRTALREAAQCGIWRIHDDVHQAIEKAIHEYEAEGAPFYQPNSTQALGWVDEHSSLRCLKPGIGSCQPDTRYQISTRLENTDWITEKINLAGQKEKMKYSGKELLVSLTDEDGTVHDFHVRRDDAKIDPTINPDGKVINQHWHISDLIQHFEIPVVKDITDLRPDTYRENLDALDRIERIVSANLTAA